MEITGHDHVMDPGTREKSVKSPGVHGNPRAPMKSWRIGFYINDILSLFR